MACPQSLAGDPVTLPFMSAGKGKKVAKFPCFRYLTEADFYLTEADLITKKKKDYGRKLDQLLNEDPDPHEYWESLDNCGPGEE